MFNGLFDSVMPTLRQVAQNIGEFMLNAFAVAGIAIDEGYTQLEIFQVACKKYGWCLTPDFDLPLLAETVRRANDAGNSNHRLYLVLRDVFRANDFALLEQLVNRMSDGFHPKRRKILFDCIHALRQHGVKHFNAANLVVPTCITIIDGMLSDFAHECGISNWQNRKSGAFARLKGEIESVAYEFDRPAIELIFETLFATAYYGKTPSSGRKFNRHWIAHGNWIEYGRLEHVLRLFLMIRFLDYIIYEYQARAHFGITDPYTDASKYSKMLSENPVAPIRDMLRARLAERNISMRLDETIALEPPEQTETV